MWPIWPIPIYEIVTDTDILTEPISDLRIYILGSALAKILENPIVGLTLMASYIKESTTYLTEILKGRVYCKFII
jgi:hypothetical protein